MWSVWARHHHLHIAGEGHCITPVPWPRRMADLHNVKGMLPVSKNLIVICCSNMIHINIVCQMLCERSANVVMLIWLTCLYICVKQFSSRPFTAASTPVPAKPCHSSAGKISKFESLKVRCCLIVRLIVCLSAVVCLLRVQQIVTFFNT